MCVRLCNMQIQNVEKFTISETFNTKAVSVAGERVWPRSELAEWLQEFVADYELSIDRVIGAVEESLAKPTVVPL